MQRLVRTLAVVSFILLLAGLQLRYMLGGLVCFNGCPRDVPGAVLGFHLKVLGPGLVAATTAWIISLLALARSRRWIVGALVLVVPLILIALAYAFGPYIGLRALMPGPAGQLSLLLTAAALVFSGLMLAICFLRVRWKKAAIHAQ